MKHLIFALIGLTLLIGCSSKPTVIYKTVEVKVPVKCNVVWPTKPLYDGKFTSARALAEYFLEIEDLLRICTNAE